MAQTFNLTARINAQGPFGVKPVIDKLRSDLKNIKASVNITIPKGVEGRLDTVHKRLCAIEAKLKSVAAASKTTAGALGVLDSRNAKSGQIVQKNTRALTNNNAVMAKTARGAAEAASELEEFGRVSGLAIRRFAGFTIATGVIFGFITAIKQGVSEAIIFERQMIKVSQVTKTSLTNLKGLTNEITRLSTTFGVSSKDLSNVSLILSQAGLSAIQTKKALEALAKSSLAPTFSNITATTEGAIAAMSQFELQVKDLDSALGSINAVAAKFAVESDDIIAAVRRTGGVFAAASQGIGTAQSQLQEFIALFTSVRATTRESAESIATGLRTIFTRIQRRSTVESLRELGIELVDNEGKFIGVFNAVKQLSRGLKDLDPRDVRFSAITEELGGFRQIGKTIPLIQRFATAQEALQVAQQGTNSLTDDSKVALQALATQLSRTQEIFLSFTRNFTQSGTFKVIAGSILTVTNSFIGLLDSLQPILPILATVAAFKISSGLFQFVGGFGKGARGQISPSGTGSSSAQIQTTASNTNATKQNTLALKTKTRGGFGSGGPIKRFRTGGKVGGVGSGDRQPILAEAGEVVMNRGGVARAGLANLLKLNKGGRIRRAGGSEDRESVSFKGQAKNASASEIKAFIAANDIPLPKSIDISKLTDDTKSKQSFFNRLQSTQFDKDGAISRQVIGKFGTGKNAVGNGTNASGSFIPSIESKSGNPLAAAVLAQPIGKRTDSHPLFTQIEALKAKGILQKDDKRFSIPIVTAGLSAEKSRKAQGAIKLGIDNAIEDTAKSLLPGISETALLDNLANVTKATSAMSGQVFEAALSAAAGSTNTKDRDGFDFRGQDNIKKLEPLFGNLPVRFADAKFTNSINNKGKPDIRSALGEVRDSVIAELLDPDKTALRSEVRGRIFKERTRSGRAFGGEGGIPALTTPGEAIFNAKAVDRLGVDNLARLNRTGDLSNISRIKSSDFSTVPGTGNSDTYPSNLEEGSFVIRKDSSLAAGLNSRNSVRRLASGGSVSRFASGGPTGRGGNQFGKNIFDRVGAAFEASGLIGAKELEAALKAAARSIANSAADLDSGLITKSGARVKATQAGIGAVNKRRAAIGAEAALPVVPNRFTASGRASVKAAETARKVIAEALRKEGNSLRGINQGLKKYDLALSAGATQSQAFRRAQRAATAGTIKREAARKTSRREIEDSGGFDFFSSRSSKKRGQSISAGNFRNIGSRLKDRLPFIGNRKSLDAELSAAENDEERRTIKRDRRSRTGRNLTGLALLGSFSLPGLIGNSTPLTAGLSSGALGATTGGAIGAQAGAAAFGTRGGIAGGAAGAALSGIIGFIGGANQKRLADAQKSLTDSTNDLDRSFSNFEKGVTLATTNALKSDLGAGLESILGIGAANAQSVGIFGSTSSFLTQLSGIFTGGSSLFSTIKELAGGGISETNIGGGVTTLDRRLASQSLSSASIAGFELPFVENFDKIQSAADKTRNTFARNLFEQSRGQRDIATQAIASEVKRGQTIDDITNTFGDKLNVLGLSNLKSSGKVSNANLNAEAIGEDGRVAAIEVLKRLAASQIKRIVAIESEKVAIEKATQASVRRVELLSLRFKELGDAAQFALTAGRGFDLVLRDVTAGFNSIQKLDIRDISNIGFETDASRNARTERGISLLGSNNPISSFLGNIERTLQTLETVGPTLLKQAAEEASIKLDAGGNLSPEEVGLDLFKRLDAFSSTPESFKDAFISSFRQVFSTRQGEGPEALRTLLENDPDKLLEAIRTSIGTAAINARKELDKTFESLVNNLSAAGNEYTKALIASANAQDKVLNLQINSANKVRKLRGLEDSRIGTTTRQLQGQVGTVTSRFGGRQANNVDDIFNNLQRLRTQRAGLNTRRDASTSGVEQRELINSLIQNQLQIDQNTKALNLVATETNRLGSIEAELADIEKRKQAGRTIVERLAVARVDPKANIQLQKEIRGAFAVLGRGKIGVGEGGGQALQSSVSLLRQLASAIGGKKGRNLEDIVNQQLGQIAGGTGGLPALLSNALKPSGETGRERVLIEQFKTVTSEQISAIHAQSQLAQNQAADISTNIKKLTDTQIAELRNLTQIVAADLKTILIDTFAKLKEREEAKRLSKKLSPEKKGLRTGGFVGGQFRGNKDTELRGLVPGEFVVKRDVAQRFGPELSQLNNGGSVRGFQDGGFVPRTLQDRDDAELAKRLNTTPAKIAETRRLGAELRTRLAKNEFNRNQVVVKHDERAAERKAESARLRARNISGQKFIDSGADSFRLTDGTFFTKLGTASKFGSDADLPSAVISKDVFEKERDSMLKYGILGKTAQEKAIQSQVFAEAGQNINEVRALARNKADIFGATGAFTNADKQERATISSQRLRDITTANPELSSIVASIEREQASSEGRKLNATIRDQGKNAGLKAGLTIGGRLAGDAINPFRQTELAGTALKFAGEGKGGLNFIARGLGDALERSGKTGNEAIGKALSVAGDAVFVPIAAGQARSPFGTTGSGKTTNRVANAAVKNLLTTFTRDRDFVDEAISQNEEDVFGNRAAREILGAVTLAGIGGGVKGSIAKSRNLKVRKVEIANARDSIAEQFKKQSQFETKSNQLASLRERYGSSAANRFIRNRSGVKTPNFTGNKTSAAQRAKQASANKEFVRSRRQAPFEVTGQRTGIPVEVAGQSPIPVEIAGQRIPIPVETISRSASLPLKAPRPRRRIQSPLDKRGLQTELANAQIAAERNVTGAAKKRTGIPVEVIGQRTGIPVEVTGQSTSRLTPLPLKAPRPNTRRRSIDTSGLRGTRKISQTELDQILKGAEKAKNKTLASILREFITSETSRTGRFQKARPGAFVSPKAKGSKFKTVAKFGAAGIIGTAIAPSIFQASKREASKILKLLGVPGFAEGGSVDSTLAALTPGEFVVRKNVAQKNGKFLQQLNKGGVPAFQDGGFVGGSKKRRMNALNNETGLIENGGHSRRMNALNNETGLIENNGGRPRRMNALNNKTGLINDGMPMSNMVISPEAINALTSFSNSTRELGTAISGLSNLADVSNQLARVSKELSNINIPTSITMEVAPIQVNVIHNGAEVFSGLEESVQQLIAANVSKGIKKHINIITGETNTSFLDETSPIGSRN